MTYSNRHLPLKLINLGYKRNRSMLIKNIDIEVNSRGTTIILGHNGAGKSLLLKLLHGVIVPTNGQIYWNNCAPATKQYWRTLLLQNPTFFRRSVRFNLDFVLRVAGIPAQKRQSLCLQALEICGLTAVSKRSTSVLSGGEQQRLSLARAWVLQPDVLLLDEPTVALDPPASLVLENIVQRFKKSHTKVIMTTHDLAQAKRLADDIVFMHAGAILEQRDAKDFFEFPNSKAAQNFLGGKLS